MTYNQILKQLQLQQDSNFNESLTDLFLLDEINENTFLNNLK